MSPQLIVAVLAAGLVVFEVYTRVLQPAVQIIMDKLP